MKMFKKNEVTFAVLLIIVYVIGNNIGLIISDTAGIKFFGEMIINILMAAAVFIFIRLNGLSEYLGLKKPEISASKMLFYIPLVLIGGGAAFFGIRLEYSPVVSIIRTVMMLCVGFLEEIIFRGFLFRGIAKSNLTRAVVISSITFGIGHIVNLFTGSNLFDNMIQIVYAVAVGFLLVFIFLRTSSIIPCIAFHAFNNSMTAFTNANILTDRFGEKNATLILVFTQLVIVAAYLFYVTRLSKRELPAL